MIITMICGCHFKFLKLGGVVLSCRVIDFYTMLWLDGITDLMGMSLSRLWGFVMDREAWRAEIHWVAKSQTRLSD